MLIGLVAALIWMDPVLTLVAGVTVPFVAGPIGRIGRKLRRVSTSTQEQMGATASLISESLQGARVAKTFAMESYLKGRAAAALDEVRRLKMKAANARGRLDPLLEIGGGIAVAGVLVLVGQRVLAGEKTVGDFTGYVAALLLAAQPARALGNLNAILQEAAAALRRYFDVMDEVPTIREAPDARPLAIAGGGIRFADVHFRYRPDAPALEGIDLAVPAGSVTALVGRSGSGKSSLLNLVPRLYDVTGGAVTIDGQDVRTVTLASLRAAVAVVSQEVVLFDDTIAANIGFGRPGATRAEIEAAAAAGRGPHLRHGPAGGLRLPGRIGRRPALRRRAAAGGPRPRLPQGRADPAPRRGDLGPRFRIGAPRPGGADLADARPDHPGDRPPALDGARGRSDRRDGRRPRDRDWAARRPARGRRPLRAPPPVAAVGTGDRGVTRRVTRMCGDAVMRRLRRSRAPERAIRASVDEDHTVSDLTFEIQSHPTPRTAEERAALMANPGFGKVFTDHMVVARYTAGRGWHDARIQAREAIPLDPAAAVLHYAQEIFEGLKAYRTADGGAALFRPEANALRFRRSAERMAMAPFPEDAFVEAMRKLVEIDRAWIPDTPDGSLYLRPFMIASEAFLGVKPASEYLFVTIASAVGSYFKDPTGTVTVWISEHFTRAAPGERARPSAAATTPRASRRSRKRRPRAASRWCSWTRPSAGSSRNSAA